jgi:hypothetical protein
VPHSSSEQRRREQCHGNGGHLVEPTIESQLVTGTIGPLTSFADLLRSSWWGGFGLGSGWRERGERQRTLQEETFPLQGVKQLKCMGPAVHFALPVGDRGPCKRGILFALRLWITRVGLSLSVEGLQYG